MIKRRRCIGTTADLDVIEINIVERSRVALKIE